MRWGVRKPPPVFPWRSLQIFSNLCFSCWFFWRDVVRWERAILGGFSVLIPGSWLRVHFWWFLGDHMCSQGLSQDCLWVKQVCQQHYTIFLYPDSALPAPTLPYWFLSLEGRTKFWNQKDLNQLIHPSVILPSLPLSLISLFLSPFLSCFLYPLTHVIFGQYLLLRLVLLLPSQVSLSLFFFLICKVGLGKRERLSGM